MADYRGNPQEIERAINAFAFSDDCPEEIKDELQMLSGSQADRIQAASEIIYANFDIVPEAGKRAMQQVLEYAIQQNWTTYVEKVGAEKIVEFTARELGDKGALKAPAPTEWPEPVRRRNEKAAASGKDWRGVPEVEMPLDDQELEEPGNQVGRDKPSKA